MPRGGTAPRAVLLLVAAALVGWMRGAGLNAWVPRARVGVTVERLHALVVRGCVPDGKGGSACELRVDDGRRVVLRVEAPGCRGRPGDRIEALATVHPFVPAVNGARAGPGATLVRRGVAYTAVGANCTTVGEAPDAVARVRRAALALRTRLDGALGTSMGALGAARARALLFGDESGLSDDDGEAFRVSGLAHLLAVSGAHVALLSAWLGALCAWVLRRVPWLVERGWLVPTVRLLPMPFVAVFVAATGESASALRAWVAAVFAMMVTLAGRRPRGPELVAVSALGTAAVEPAWVFDAGWQLSIVAAWALASGERARVESTATYVRSLGRFWIEGLRASGRVALVASPVLAWHFQQVPLAALVCNAIAAPIGEVIALPCVLVTAAASSVPLPGSRLAGSVTSIVLDALFALPHLAVALPLASTTVVPPTPAQAVVLVVAGWSLLRTRWRARGMVVLVSALTVGALEAAHRWALSAHGNLRVTALDVGQGDALLVELPDGAAMLVDGGGTWRGPDPGARVVVPTLADRRRRDLDVVIATHPHPDHVGGLARTLAWANVRELWDTGPIRGSPSAAHEHMLAVARTRGVRVLAPADVCGPERAFHGASLRVWAPCPAREAGVSANDGSFVIQLRFGRAIVLLPGDIERETEHRLAPWLPAVTLLKIPHHGSRTSSTPEFLDRVRPRVALVSAGHPSPFDHPHGDVLARYGAIGTSVWDTSRHGAVSVLLHADGIWEASPMP